MLHVLYIIDYSTSDLLIGVTQSLLYSGKFLRGPILTVFMVDS